MRPAGDLAAPGAPAPAPSAAWRRAWPLAALALLVAFAYANAFGGAFVFDDIPEIRDNRLLRDLGSYLPGGEGQRSLPTRWVGYLTFAVNYRLGGLSPRGYHAVNVGVHLGATLLVYALVVLTFRTPRLRGSALAEAPAAPAFLAAALFATHPLQTQAVTYVVQRLTSLATLLYLLAVVLYVRWRLAGLAGRPRPARAGGYALVLASLVLAMHTKEIAFTCPLALAAYEACFFGPGPRRRWWALGPLLATSLLVPIAVLRLSRPAGEVLADAADRLRVLTPVSRGDYLVTQLAVVAKYLGLLAWPAGQNLDHDFPLFRSLLAPRVLLSLALHLALLALAAYLLARTAKGRARPLDPAWRLVAFGVVWFFLALSVESSLVPIVDLVYEHRVYLPSAGLFAAVATAAALLLRRLSPEDPARATALLAVLLALLLGGLTLRRNAVWADDLTLWTDAVERSPGKARPHLNLGTALVDAGQPARAAAELEAGLALAPASSYGHAQLGVVLLSLGRTGEGEGHLREALRLEPRDPEATFNLAMVLWQTGRRPEAQRLFARFLEVAPASDLYARARRVAAARAGR